MNEKRSVVCCAQKHVPKPNKAGAGAHTPCHPRCARVRYIHLEAAILKTVSDEFHVRTAKTVQEAIQLLEVSFEYVTDMDGAKLFRERK